MTIPGSAHPLLMASLAEPEAYQIERSLRFNSSDSAYLSRVPSTAGNRKTFTVAFWIKRNKPVANFSPTTESVFGAAGGSSWFDISFYTIDELQVITNAGAGDTGCRTQAVFRDFSAWMHFVVAVDTTDSTANDRIKIYVNGVRQAVNIPTGMPALNSDTFVNSTTAHYFGRDGRTSSVRYGSHYLSDVHFIDGQALDPTSFGEFDTNGIWQPIDASGLTYGTNGFHLPFSDYSTAAALGTDTSGNGNNWTVNNIAVGGSVNFPGIIQPGIFSTNPTNLRNEIELWNDDPLALNNDRSSSWGSFGSGNILTMDFSSLNLSFTSSLTIWHRPNNGWRTYYTLQGGSETIIGGSDGWFSSTITGSGRLTQIRIYGGTNSGGPKFVGLELDGVQVIGLQGPGNDSLVDSPTNGTQTDTGAGGEVVGNYCTFNPVDSNQTHSNGNLFVTCAGGTSPRAGTGTIAVSSGKYYYEITVTESDPAKGIIGFVEAAYDGNGSTIPNFNGNSVFYFGEAGQKFIDGSSSSYGASYGNGDVIGVALNLDDDEITFYKNGSSQGTITTKTFTGAYKPAVGRGASTGSTSYALNAGQRPFAYTAPSGFKALCTANLPTPTIEKGSDYFDIKTYTGNGSSQSISGLDFSPDLVWLKNRSGTTSHRLTDKIRGDGYSLFSNSANAEDYQNAGGYISSLNSDGFTVIGGTGTNDGSYTYVGWAWDGGTSTESNTDGSITSSVRANQSAGFSIVSYTGSNSNSTIGHGLEAQVEFAIIKNRDASLNWKVYHKSLGNTKALTLNTTAAEETYNYWQNTAPTSTLFYLSGGVGNTCRASEDFVAYCFAPVDGYSSFGSYTGNGSADGPFVFCNFRPRWILIKNTTSGIRNWVIFDSQRNTYNTADYRLSPNSSDAELTQGAIDFVSNGFKIRNGSAAGYPEINTSGENFIYAAFAENPFSIARAR